MRVVLIWRRTKYSDGYLGKVALYRIKVVGWPIEISNEIQYATAA